MVHYPLRPHTSNHPIRKPKPTKRPGSLNESNTYSNRFRIFCTSLMPSTSNTMINTKCLIIFRWEIKFGCTYRNNSLQDRIGTVIHSDMDLTSSPRLWVTMILSSTFPPSFTCTQCLIWTSFDHTFFPYWKPRRS
jgi:hypothetical protein